MISVVFKFYETYKNPLIFTLNSKIKFKEIYKDPRHMKNLNEINNGATGLLN